MAFLVNFTSVRCLGTILLPAVIEKYTTINNIDTNAMRTSEVRLEHHHLLMCNPEIFVWLIMFREGAASESG
jgi:hypothetical protein